MIRKGLRGFTFEEDLAFPGLVDECQHFKQSAFAAAVGADDTGDGARLDGKTVDIQGWMAIIMVFQVMYMVEILHGSILNFKFLILNESAHR